MLPYERRERIKALIRTNQTMKIAELSKELGVSEMTIHRDLKPLVEEGIVVKTFGGVSWVRSESKEVSLINECVYCRKVINERLAYRLILTNREMEVACCVHCGLLRGQQLGNQVFQAICYDFLRHTTISAHEAWFVTGTTLNLGCCKPQILPFEHRHHAEQFIKGFEGEILSLNEALEQLTLKTVNGTLHCHQKQD
ncbi:DeoR family transcriptional regulator [Pullulanibacillus sp. KACC 23026]|uniref:DeoR family transcriptional regulator n=1 Tax=Pullulanibacillus sp. KACC 23026 TaxID=3028315 RepID=UPI0023B0C963|nr:DeoR family transcriptional regulator [Pullulanibacillus sp. KACC 23026]WEG13665.1 DeoR family transcriptional regulator [Pullulanibacillus sp. KACC 23026]